MTRAFTRLSRFGACALACFAFDVDDALDVALLPLTSDRRAPLLCLAYGLALAFLAWSTFGARVESASHVRRRAYAIAALATVPFALAARVSGVVALGLLFGACAFVALVRIVRPTRALVIAALLPLVITGSVFAFGLFDVPSARAAIIRRLKVESIVRGTTRYVPGWGFVDVSHIHPGIYRVALAQLEATAPEVRVQTEIIDLTGDIYVIERVYRPLANDTPRWALACAIALDIGLEAERAQAQAPWWMGFGPSAYQFDDLPSNVLGCLAAAGRVSPRSIAYDTSAALERFRAEASALSRQRRTTYALPLGATEPERAALRTIEAAGRSLDRSAVSVSLHPVSR